MGFVEYGWLNSAAGEARFFFGRFLMGRTREGGCAGGFDGFLGNCVLIVLVESGWLGERTSGLRM